MSPTGSHPLQPIRSILIADDDPDDQLLVKEAFAESGWAGTVAAVGSGEELLSALGPDGAGTGGSSFPDLILLDLNMPRLDGRETLRILRSDPRFRRVRIVVLTTSDSPQDIRESYDLGADSYIIKPSSYRDLVSAMRSVANYWFSTVRLP